MVLNSIEYFFQCSAIFGISSLKSRNVKPSNPPVCVDKTEVGKIAHSMPIAEISGRATVMEHLPKHDISCIVTILFILSPLFDIISPRFEKVNRYNILIYLCAYKNDSYTEVYPEHKENYCAEACVKI